MVESKKKSLIIGTGAIGGVVVGLIKTAGYDVEAVCKYPALATQFVEEGIYISGVKGDLQINFPAVPNITDVKDQKDFIILAIKATDLPPVLEKINTVLHEQSRVIVMENGICEDLVAKYVPKEQVVGCVTGWGATMHEKGKVEMTSTGEFVIGYLDGRTDEHLSEIQIMLNNIVPTEISTNIYGALYSKLIINSCITSLGALNGLLLGEMLKDRITRNIFIEIIREAMQVADAMNLDVEPYGGKLDYYSFLESTSFFGKLKRHLMIRIIGFKYRKLKSSSLQSLERGKPTEIDFFNGYITEKAQKFQIDTPINTSIVKMIKEIEKGERAIDPANIREIAQKNQI